MQHFSRAEFLQIFKIQHVFDLIQRSLQHVFMPIHSATQCRYITDHDEAAILHGDKLNENFIHFMVAPRALSWPVGKENQLGMEKIPMRFELEFGFFHIIPVVRRAVSFPKPNFLVYGFKFRDFCHLKDLMITFNPSPMYSSTTPEPV